MIMMGVVNKLFPNAAELADAKKRIEELEIERSDLLQRNSDLLQRNRALSESFNQAQKAKNELNELKKKQTDADLILVSARIILSTIRGDRPAASDVSLQQSLLAQQKSFNVDHYGGLLNYLGLGIGGIFGQR
jgi:chromosome segregation ATPase